MLTDPEEDYARGWVPFLGARICLDSRPLIPRTETEFWVEKAIQEIVMIYHNNFLKRSPAPRILDLFAGSGAIGVAVLMHVQDSLVTFAEKEPRHLETIRKSLDVNHIARERASLVESDVWRGVAGPFEYILTNPPYISKERNTVSTSTQKYEPPEALFASDDGFFFIGETIRGAPQFLTPNGSLWIEHEPFQKERVSEAGLENGFLVSHHLDQYGTVRYSTLTRHTVAY